MKSLFKFIVVQILTALAWLTLRKYKPRIVAVTGTVGKTTTKDAIYSGLAGFFNVRKSEKSFNSEIGIPLTILGCANPGRNPIGWISVFLTGILLVCRQPARGTYPEWLVIEVGADRPGDIKKSGRLLCPDIAVITRFAEVPVHIEFFDSVEQVIEEKSALARAVRRGGIIVLGSDDKKVLQLKKIAERTALTFGTDNDAEVIGEAYEVVYEKLKEDSTSCPSPIGIRFMVRFDGKSFPVFIFGGLGRPLMQAALAAFAVGVSLSLDLKLLADFFRKFSPPTGRMRILHGIRQTTIIDDSYNASPAALQEAFQTLKSLEVSGKRVAVLGDMLELGKFTTKEHLRAGTQAASVSDLLIVVGLRARGFVEGAKEAGMSEKNIRTFENSFDAGKALQEILAPGDIVLVKGSQRMRMERIVFALMAEPERAKEFLARQEKEWDIRK